MKTLFYLLSFSVILGCGSNHGKQNPQNETTATAEANTSTQQETGASEENSEQETTGEPLQEPSSMPVGEINVYDLKAAPHGSWFNRNFENYEPSAEAMAVIDENINDYEIKVFMGTWCPDSRREVPKFFKILELADYDLNQLEMYGVDRGKNTPKNLQDTFNIIRVPTMIFFKDGKEVGRFVEHPRESLATDIAKIVSGQDYKHSYMN
ncbi:MAG TPA: thioredoxin family protein [Salinimicrobium sp.]|nr:thioredoxin family protein [Salinimicrobium sp.]